MLKPSHKGYKAHALNRQEGKTDAQEQLKLSQYDYMFFTQHDR